MRRPPKATPSWEQRSSMNMITTHPSCTATDETEVASRATALEIIEDALVLSDDAGAEAADWESIRLRATPALVGRSLADAVTNLAHALEVEQDVLTGNWRGAYPAARSYPEALQAAIAEAAGCYAAVLDALKAAGRASRSRRRVTRPTRLAA